MTEQVPSKSQRAISWLKEKVTSRYGRVFIDFSIITLIAVIIFRIWLFTNGWPAGGDVSGWISRAYIFGKDFRWLYIWRPYAFGFTEGINAMDFFLMLINFLFNNASATVKIFTFSSFLTAGFSMYGLTYHYTHRHVAALAGSMVYCLNQWIFSQYTEAHIDIIFSYAVIPLIFLILVRALERRKLKDILGLAIALAFLVTSFHPECIVIYGAFLFMFTVFYLLSSAHARKLRVQTKNVLKVVLPACAVGVILATFVVLPMALNVRASYYSATFKYPIEDAKSASYANMIDAFTLRALESWGYNLLIDVYTDLSLPDFPVYELLSIIFLLAFCTVFIRRDRYTVFFAISAMAAIFVAKGPNFPFGYIFTWMWSNVPYFAVFRAANRTNMITAFSFAFLVSVLAKMLLDYTQKRNDTKTKVHFEMKAKFAGENEAREMYITIESLNRILKGAHKVLHYLSVLLLIFIFLSCFLSCSYFFSQGLQVYTPSDSYLGPYDWLANQSGDYKVITASNSPSEAMNSQSQESDFASGGMLTDIGWSHDIGYDSAFITDKPTLQDGGWYTSSRALINYLRFRLVRQYLSDDILRMLGTFNYKYVVLPEYLASGTKNFFLNQQGYQIVYNQGSIILQNEYYTPRFFAASQTAYLVGGLESYSALHKIDNFKLNQTALYFAYQTNEAFSDIAFNNSETVIFANNDITETVMLSLKNDATFINAADYGMPTTNFTKYWASSTSWREIGDLVWSGSTLSTNGKNDISIPFKIDADGNYDIWLRIGIADNRGTLTTLIDGTPVEELRSLSKTWSKLMWVKITSLNLKSGDHKITLKNDGTGYNDIDMIAAVKPETFQSGINNVNKALQEYTGRIIYCLGGVNTFTLSQSNVQVTLIPYEGYFVGTANEVNVAPLGKASASSEGTWGTTTLWAQYANDGTTDTRWASTPHESMPQWLQIEWTVPQEINSVHVLFEQAHAQDYTIQTWDGTQWVDQVNVTGNTMLEQYHSFPTTATTKLRIYITSVTQRYDLASIIELEAYNPTGIYTDIALPREGDYMFALRIETGPDEGKLNLQVDDATETADCSDANQGFTWKYFGPYHLDAANHTIALNGDGKITFDEMLIYSLNQNEQTLSVNELFTSKSAPTITYEQINPCKYTVHIENSNAPFLLVFSEAYDPMWKAYVENNEISSVSMYSIVNGFYIEKTGSFDITIYFTGQTYVDTGLKISIATLITVATIIAIPSKKLKEIEKSIKHKIFRTNLKQKERSPPSK